MGDGAVSVARSPFDRLTGGVELPRELRANQGSDEVTAWCPTCEERAVPMRDGTCAFCQTPIGEQSPAAPVRLAAVPPVSADGGQDEPGLRLSDDLLLPLDAATQSLAILAVKGSGKSNAAAVLAEELFDWGIPWVVIDPKGDWWGIREAVDESRGLPVLVLGGLHGDLPLSVSSGAAVARLIVERNLTCVLDVSAMDDDDRPVFLHALGEELFELHRQHPSVRHLIVEEAQETVPEGANKRMLPTVKAWTRIVCQGRQRGLGITLVSQRSALISKNVLTQTGSLIVLRTTSPQDRTVIRGWVDFHSVSKEMIDSLPELANGEAWIVAPQWLGRVERVRIRRRWTFDSGATPEVVATRSAQTLDSVDIEEIARVLSGERPEPEAPPSQPEVDLSVLILAQLAHGPVKIGELVRACDSTASKVGRALHDLAERGGVEMRGRRGGAIWALPEPEAEESTAEPTPPAAELASRFVAARRDAQDALAELDGILDQPDGTLTLLRARYLAALLARIEAGEQDPELLDRFERIAGFLS